MCKPILLVELLSLRRARFITQVEPKYISNGRSHIEHRNSRIEVLIAVTGAVKRHLWREC